MRRFILLALLFLASTVFASANIQKLHLYFSLTEGEHSRDGSATTTTIRINGNQLVYDQSYSGYRAGSRKPVHKEIKIKDEDVEKLRGLITSKRPLASVSFEHPIDSPGRYSIIFLNVLTEKKKTLIRISGMTKELGGEKLYQNVQALREEVQRIIDDSQ